MENQLPEFAILICGGKGIRTPDLLIANETLYQLSYTPAACGQLNWLKAAFRQVPLTLRLLK